MVKLHDTHPLIKAQVTAILECEDVEKLLLMDSAQICKPTEFLDREVIILGAWPLESDYPDSALVLVEDNYGDTQSFVIARGNAGRQALYLHERKLTPAVRVLTTVEVNEHDLYFWRIPR